MVIGFNRSVNHRGSFQEEQPKGRASLIAGIWSWLCYVRRRRGFPGTEKGKPIMSIQRTSTFVDKFVDKKNKERQSKKNDNKKTILKCMTARGNSARAIGRSLSISPLTEYNKPKCWAAQKERRKSALYVFGGKWSEGWKVKLFLCITKSKLGSLRKRKSAHVMCLEEATRKLESEAMASQTCFGMLGGSHEAQIARFDARGVQNTNLNLHYKMPCRHSVGYV